MSRSLDDLLPQVKEKAEEYLEGFIWNAWMDDEEKDKEFVRKEIFDWIEELPWNDKQWMDEEITLHLNW
jgi:hypothetical protein